MLVPYLGAVLSDITANKRIELPRLARTAESHLQSDDAHGSSFRAGEEGWRRRTAAATKRIRNECDGMGGSASYVGRVGGARGEVAGGADKIGRGERSRRSSHPKCRRALRPSSSNLVERSRKNVLLLPRHSSSFAVLFPNFKGLKVFFPGQIRAEERQLAKRRHNPASWGLFAGGSASTDIHLR